MAAVPAAAPSTAPTISLVFEDEPTSKTQSEIRCCALQEDGTVCDKRLRDASGLQVRDDVSCSRRECQHVLCANCLLRGSIEAAQKGRVYSCTLCGHKYLSWDTRKREDSGGAVKPVGRAQGKLGRGDVGLPTSVFKTERVSWGPQPDAYFRSAHVRDFYLANPPPVENPPEAGWEPPKVGNFAFAVSAGTADGVRTWDGAFVGKPASELGADEEVLLHASLEAHEQLFRVLGRQLRASVVQDCKASFPVSGKAAQVDYEQVCSSAIDDKSVFGAFLRSLCCGESKVAPEPKL